MSIVTEDLSHIQTTDITATPILSANVPDRGSVEFRLTITAQDVNTVPIEWKAWDWRGTASRNGVGDPIVLAPITLNARASAGAGSWAIFFTNNGGDDPVAVVRVKGAAGVTIVWGVSGEILTTDLDA